MPEVAERHLECIMATVMRLFACLFLLSLVAVAQPSGPVEHAVFLGEGALYPNQARSIAGIATDAVGNVYLAGSTAAADDFAGGTSAIGPTGGRADVFVVKLNPALTQILYAVKIGGSGQDFATALLVDNAGAVYVTGNSGSTDWSPISGAAPVIGMFVLKLDPAGRQIEFLSAIGGGDPRAIALDNQGRIWIGGAGEGIPITEDAIRKKSVNGECGFSGTGLGGQFSILCGDGFLVRLNPTSGEVEYGTLIGAERADSVEAITAAPDGGVFVGGASNSEEFPPGSIAFPEAGTGGFVLRFSGDDSPQLVASWKAGRVKNLSVTPTGDLAVFGAFPDFSFLHHLTLPNYQQVRFARYREEFGTSRIAWAAEGSAYLTTAAPISGDHLRSNLPLGFVTGLDPNGAVALNSLQVSGLDDPRPAVSPDGSLYMASRLSSSFPGSAATAMQTTYGGGESGIAVLRVAPVARDEPLLYRLDNAASLLDVRAQIAAGEILTIRGRGLGPESGVAGLATELGGVRVLLDGIPASLLWAQDRQINVIAPWGLERPCLPPQPFSGCGESAPIRLVVERDGRPFGFFDVPYLAASPGVFTESGGGQGQVVARNEDGAANSPASPARGGELVTFYATGLGPMRPTGVDGQIQGNERVLVTATLRVEVTISRKPAEVRFAGVRPGMVHGLFEIQAVVPEGLEPAADHRIRVRVLTEESQDGATIAIE